MKVLTACLTLLVILTALLAGIPSESAPRVKAAAVDNQAAPGENAPQTSARPEEAAQDLAINPGLNPVVQIIVGLVGVMFGVLALSPLLGGHPVIFAPGAGEQSALLQIAELILQDAHHHKV